MRLKKVQKIQEQEMPAGGFLSWLQRTRRVQITNDGANVPCGECTACCTSSYFIHIKPDETQTLARIPKELLFAAPGLPKGNVLLGYDKNGHCPMFINNKCSIYAQRPQTCRTYDCRIFSATGITVGDDKVLISQQTRRWKFDFPTAQDHQHIFAVKSAAKFISVHAGCFPAGFVPSNPTQQAVLAIKVYEVFLDTANEFDSSAREDRNHEIVATVMEVYEKFEAGENA